MPTLLLWGTEDQLIPAAQAESWAKHIPSSDIKLIEGAGHLVLEERAGAVEAVTRFLTQ